MLHLDFHLGHLSLYFHYLPTLAVVTCVHPSRLPTFLPPSAPPIASQILVNFSTQTNLAPLHAPHAFRHASHTFRPAPTPTPADLSHHAPSCISLSPLHVAFVYD
ncbi:uncharacterized protein SCHCODRAFT_01039931 [Schizophyllum commune H4-8]|uniref:uncharacterized protein n=1 Tax=Schizophyllum commune (strain H4-8 / FGSC 9210) TaxID=578458 RepID=UPI002160D3D3|nr:uncharacterized protein SCHCODRAFT_01039931 [Schizophyllum commune H4-8]KAI5889873.1 hypothetical protein SCHCODRAFT_01039931 [Schizophyllum commune H4-8]